MERRQSDLLYSQLDMANLARDTGGFAVLNTNDLHWGIGPVLDDQAGYYLIGYRPGESTSRPTKQGPRYHKLAVRVRVPGLRVRTRSGFYGVPAEEAPTAPRTPEEEIAAALHSSFRAGGIRLRLTSLFASREQQGSLIRNLLHLDARDLTLELRVRDENLSQTLAKRLLYEFDLPIGKPGASQLRIAVRDSASGRVGSAGQFIDAPDGAAGRFALSGVLLSAEGAAGEEAKPDILSDAAVRTFNPGQA
jgi:hypothetical protein